MLEAKIAVVKIEVEVPVERVHDMFTCAFEGGSNYWCHRIASFNLAPGLSKADFHEGGKLHNGRYNGLKELVPTTEGCSLTLRVDNPNDGPDVIDVVVGPAEVKKGLEVMASKHGRHFADLINENDDANTADVFLQCCCFGEVIFG